MSAPCSVFLESRHKDRGLPNSRHRTPDIEQHRHDPEVPNNMIKYTVEHPEGSPEGGDRTPSGSEDLFLSLAKDNRPRSDTEEELKRRERRKVSTEVRFCRINLWATLLRLIWLRRQRMLPVGTLANVIVLVHWHVCQPPGTRRGEVLLVASYPC